ncbi:MAG: class I SAM-dependent methyltransferase [Actinomycetota bacterium]|nr:class I SAM-dependent methyltransferase [Actinomycetota bacterium]
MPSLSGLRNRARQLWQPAPMADFEDFDEYWERRGELDTVFRRWVVAADLIEDGARVLDLGCGSGDFLRYLRTRRPNVVGVGSDSSQTALRMTRDAGFETLDLNAQDDSIPPGFDVITAFEILEHLPEAEVAIRRWVEAAGTCVIISVPNVGYIGCRIRLALFGRFPLTNCVYHIKEHVRHWTAKDFHEWTERLGLRVTHVDSQYGFPVLSKRWPSLFSAGLVYRVELAPTSVGAGRSSSSA